MKRALYIFAAILLLASPAISETEQPPYEVDDVAISENFRQIYLTVDQHKHNQDGSSRMDDVIPSSASTFSIGNSSTPWLNVVSDSGTLKYLNVSTPTIRGTDLFVSTLTAGGYPGYVIYFASGIIGANTTVTVSSNTFNAVSLGMPVCSELEGVNTAGVSVRVKSIAGLPASFTVYNADVLNEKNFICLVPGKPK